MKHTPGPWRIGKIKSVVVSDNKIEGASETGHNGLKAIEYYGGCMVAESIFRKEDAHLIAAAPDLLEALKGLVEAKRMASKNPEGVLRSMEYRWERATKAIANAESSEISKA